MVDVFIAFIPTFGRMKKRLLASATFLGMLAVILGALGAHWLKTQLGTDQLNSFETGVKYQMYHAIVLLVLGLWIKGTEGKLFNVAVWCLLTGVLLFSFSIYLLSTRSITGLEGVGFLGPTTPFGGLLMITGWLLLMVHFLRMSGSETNTQ